MSESVDYIDGLSVSVLHEPWCVDRIRQRCFVAQRFYIKASSRTHTVDVPACAGTNIFGTQVNPKMREVIAAAREMGIELIPEDEAGDLVDAMFFGRSRTELWRWRNSAAAESGNWRRWYVAEDVLKTCPEPDRCVICGRTGIGWSRKELEYFRPGSPAVCADPGCEMEMDRRRAQRWRELIEEAHREQEERQCLREGKKLLKLVRQKLKSSRPLAARSLRRAASRQPATS